MSVRQVFAISSALTALVLAVSPVMAHTGSAPAFGFVSGFLHPLHGLDHVLAMLAVGLLAAVVGGRALWLVPSSFLAAMGAGSVLANLGVPLAGVEHGIMASVVVLGLLIAALASQLPTIAAITVAAGFAVLHGYAHGAEMPAAASALSHGLGFLSATALLHGLGIAVAIGGERLSGMAVRAGGGAIAALGTVLFLV